MRRTYFLTVLGITLSACGVDSQSGPGKGTTLGSSTGELRGFAVVGSDYTSTNISLLSAEGAEESASLISSGSEDPGLSAALGGDVILPSTTLAGDELVIIDRFPSSVLTWVNLTTAKVRAQLSVATGFQSNPHDYVPYSKTKAFVTRFEPNLASGEEPFDQGSDVLVVDPERAKIVERIDLGDAFDDAREGYYPRPARALLTGGRLHVLAAGLNLDFTDQLDSRLITIDPKTNAIEHVLTFEGMHSCVNLALSPDERRLAIACSGAYGQDPAQGFPDAGVLIVDLDEEPREEARYGSPELGGLQLNDAAWLSEDRLAVLSNGRFTADSSGVEANDEAHTLDLESGELSEAWLEGSPFSIGDIACSLATGVCVVTDGETDGGVVHVLSIDASGEIIAKDERSVGTAGVSPRSLGTF